jgi:hypothetical protein
VIAADAVGAIVLASVTLYTVLGGADFGGGLGICWPAAIGEGAPRALCPPRGKRVGDRVRSQASGGIHAGWYSPVNTKCAFDVLADQRGHVGVIASSSNEAM